MTVGSCFAGIGGFDLGLERAGMTVRWQIEVDPYCRGILERHWPEVHRRGDIRLVDPDDLAPVDLVCGGFPCQPVSHAGRQKGPLDSRWLWPEMWRIVRSLRPRFVVVENVDGLRKHGLAAVLRDLAEGGYDAEWSCIRLCALGAPHARERLFLVAYPDGFDRAARLGIELHRTFAVFAGDDVARSRASVSPWLEAAPESDSLAHGVPRKLALKALGNSIVPQVAEQIGRAILATEAGR